MENEYEVRIVKPERISVNINNPRFITPAKNEKDAIRMLINLYPKKMLELVESIISDGWINDMLVFVLDSNGNMVLMDGNRRLSALKCITDPSLIPVSADTEKLLDKCKSITNKNDFNIDLYCEVWSKLCDKLYKKIENKHITERGKVKWTPMARYRFAKCVGSSYSDWFSTFTYYLKDDTKIDDVLTERVDSFRRIITGQNSQILKIDKLTGKIGYSNDKTIFNAIVEYGKQSGITRKTSDEISEKVIEIVKKNGGNPPSEFTSKSQAVATAKSVPSPTPITINKDDAKDSASFDPKPKNYLPRSLKGKYLFFIPNDFRVAASMPEKLKEMIEESKNLSILEYRYSASILFRSILQIATNNFIDRNPDSDNYFYSSLNADGTEKLDKNNKPTYDSNSLRSRFHSVNTFLYNEKKIGKDIYNGAEQVLQRESTDLIKILNSDVHRISSDVTSLIDLKSSSKALIDVLKILVSDI